MENQIKVLDVTKSLTDEDLLIVKFEGDITGLPKERVIKEIEKALNRVKPLTIPTL